MAPVIEATDLSKRYGDVVGLREVSLSIEAGEIFALIGPNGAGKTTFVRMITGALKPSGGEVVVFGRRPRADRGFRIGLLPQDFNPPERLTGREIIEYYAGLYDAARSVDAVLADVGMTDESDRWYERLSGGQQRRICVGTALVNDPELLILDEPTTGIDPRGRQRLWSLFGRLQRAGRTILLTTHDMREAETLGDRVGLLADGALLAEGSPTSLTAQYGGIGTMMLDPVGADAPAVAEAVDRSVSEGDGGVRIDGVDQASVGAVIAAVERADIDYRRLAWEAPSLEDVFLAATRDEE